MNFELITRLINREHKYIERFEKRKVPKKECIICGKGNVWNCHITCAKKQDKQFKDKIPTMLATILASTIIETLEKTKVNTESIKK